MDESSETDLDEIIARIAQLDKDHERTEISDDETSTSQRNPFLIRNFFIDGTFPVFAA